MTQTNITCPFCGLACDDLSIDTAQDQLKVSKGQCSINARAYQLADKSGIVSARVNNRKTSLREAINTAAEFLRSAESPLFSGLITDVNGMRSVMQLADQCGAVVDHQESASLFRNTRVLQDNGWITTTLTEMRNRADLVILIGEKIFEDFPRFYERVIHPKPRYQRKPRKIILLGPWDRRKLPSSINQEQITVIKAPINALMDVAGSLRAIVAGRLLDANRYGGVSITILQELAASLQESKYSVIAWSAAELQQAHGELTVEQFAGLINDLNRTTRSSGLPLGGSHAGTTAMQVCSWQSGIPIRSSFARGVPQHDSILYNGQRILNNGETDLLLWISSLRPDQTPPETDAPCVVIGHPGMKFESSPNVFIPAGIPGIDHAGHIFRMDGVVSLPLHSLRDPSYLSAAGILKAISKKVASC